MRRIKILQVITGLGPGGAERLVLDMMKRFDTDRYDVRLASLTNNLTALTVYGHPNQIVEVFDLREGSGLVNFWDMKRFLKSFAPDVIHAHMFHSLVAAVAASRFSLYEPAICFTSHLDRYSIARNLTVRLLKPWRHADIIFAPKQHPEMNVAETRVLPNGVPVESVPPLRAPWSATSTLRLLAVGRLDEQKDPLGLLRSLARFDIPRWTLDFVGGGPLEREILTVASELGFANRVNLLGVRSDVRQRMRDSDILVMHSAYEGMPMALLEAGAEAMPVIATPVGFVPEVVGNDRGYLAPAERFAETLSELAKMPNAALLAGQRLWAHVYMKHSIGTVTKAHENLYEWLFNR